MAANGFTPRRGGSIRLSLGEDLLGEGAVTTEHFGDVFDIGVGKHGEISHAVLSEQAGGIRRDSESFDEVLDGAAHLAFKDLLGVLVLLDDKVHTHEAGGEAGILTAATDGLGELFFADGEVGLLLVLIDGDADDFDGLQRLADELGGIALPANDVHFLVVELANDVFHAGTTQAHAGTHGVYFLIGAMDGHFRAVTGLAGDAGDLDGAVTDLADFEFK